MESCAEAAGPMDENPPPLGGGSGADVTGRYVPAGCSLPPPHWPVPRVWSLWEPLFILLSSLYLLNKMQ